MLEGDYRYLEVHLLLALVADGCGHVDALVREAAERPGGRNRVHAAARALIGQPVAAEVHADDEPRKRWCGRTGR